MPFESYLPQWFVQLGILGGPLILCSVAALAISCERCIFYFKSCGATQKQQYDELSSYLASHKEQPQATRDEIVNVILSQLTPSYYKGIKGLRLIGTISPMLGLLGTVLGIIACFKSIAAHATQVTPGLIADGLWEAMLTTALGLLIALPALLMAHLCQYISERQLTHLSTQLNWLSLSFEVQKHPSSHQLAPLGNLGSLV